MNVVVAVKIRLDIDFVGVAVSFAFFGASVGPFAVLIIAVCCCWTFILRDSGDNGADVSVSVVFDDEIVFVFVLIAVSFV